MSDLFILFAIHEFEINVLNTLLGFSGVANGAE